eukprot:TRINITY_DN10263_c0_g1_i1.p1 TRINITY_DN10263_c0_g1~~TRINITY_DN10263_c0_g1_i1.p1  ORF type:complete len:189 (+),score=12.53 TRINITY_DN10263_c0_g1_i1:83-649(+)
MANQNRFFKVEVAQAIRRLVANRAVNQAAFAICTVGTVGVASYAGFRGRRWYLRSCYQRDRTHAHLYGGYTGLSAGQGSGKYDNLCGLLIGIGFGSLYGVVTKAVVRQFFLRATVYQPLSDWMRLRWWLTVPIILGVVTVASACGVSWACKYYSSVNPEALSVLDRFPQTRALAATDLPNPRQECDVV